MPNPWVMLMIVGLILADFSLGFYEGDRHATDQYMLANDSGLIKAENNVITQGQQSAAVNTQIEGDYDKQIQSVVTAYLHGLTAVRLPAKSTAGSVPTVPRAASGVDVAAQDRRLKIAQTNEKLCDIQINDLQKWVRFQQNIYP